MVHTSIYDNRLAQRAHEMKNIGMLVSDISKQLSTETGTRITQMSVWRMLDSIKEDTEKELLETDFPSLEDYSYIFNKKFQKDKNLTIIKNDGETIRRDLMIRILTNYYNKEFTYMEVKNECKDREGESNFLAHWKYLLKFHYIEKVDDYKFKFCDRVREWKTFNKR